MREAHTYRAARKAFVKAQAKEAGKKFRDVWPTAVQRKAPPLNLHAASPARGKYMPHVGAKQRARYARHSALPNQGAYSL